MCVKSLHAKTVACSNIRHTVLYVLQVDAMDMSDMSVAAQYIFQRLKKAVVGQASFTGGVDANVCNGLGTLLWRHALCPKHVASNRIA